MQEAPLMPKATAVWLVENTALSFDQVAEFCKLHPLEVKAIADGDAAQGIKGLDPIQTGQLADPVSHTCAILSFPKGWSQLKYTPLAACAIRRLR